MNLEAMKSQTIGVEVEMAKIRRDNAAKIAADLFGTGRYEYTAARNGYYCWSAWDAQDREWKFQYDSSIRGDSEEKCGLVTPILKYEDIELLQELLRALRKAGAKSHAGYMCGVHIHIGAAGHTPATLRNLTNLMASHEFLLSTALNLDADRIDRYCQVVDVGFLAAVNEKRPATMAELADIWYTENHARYGRDEHYNSSRYHMLNLHATFTKGTIEFRLFQFDRPSENRRGGIHAGQLKSYIQLCLALSQQAKEARSCSWKQPQMANPKYSMRCWLLRLGFIGPEFETARDFLTRNLPGDAAFRNGRPSAAA
jgi:hypothetical protein